MASLWTSSHSPSRALSRLCRLNHHGCGAKSPANSRQSRDRSRRSDFPWHIACLDTSLRTRRDTAYLALPTPRQTFEKRPRNNLFFEFRCESYADNFQTWPTGFPRIPDRPFLSLSHCPGSFRRDYLAPRRARRPAVNRESIFAANRRSCKLPTLQTDTDESPNVPTDTSRKRSFRSLFAICCFLVRPWAISRPTRLSSILARLSLFLSYLRSSWPRGCPSIVRAVAFIRRLKLPVASTGHGIVWFRIGRPIEEARELRIWIANFHLCLRWSYYWLSTMGGILYSEH